MSEPHDGPEGESSPPRPMTPLDRRHLRAGHLPQATPIQPPEPDDADGDWSGEPGEEPPRASRQDLDPVLGYILAMALSVGLTPLHANLRYVLLWAFLAAMGGIAFVLGSGISLKTKDPGDLMWGVGLGVFTGGALLLVGSDTLAVASGRLFDAGQTSSAILDTWVFQAMVFVMPIAETLFFRGAMQRVHTIPIVALLASLWSILMFFPNLELGNTPVVGVVIGVALVLLNFLYSYVHFRHGLASSFFCQVTAGTLLLLVPRVLTL